MLTLYGISNCDTVRKARQTLESRQVPYRFHDFRQDGISRQKIEQWCQQLGWETLLNKRGTTFRGLPEKHKLNLNRELAIELMHRQPTLIKRPVVEKQAGVYLGLPDQ